MITPSRVLSIPVISCYWHCPAGFPAQAAVVFFLAVAFFLALSFFFVAIPITSGLCLRHVGVQYGHKSALAIARG